MDFAFIMLVIIALLSPGRGYSQVPFSTGNLVVFRSGDGAAALSTASTVVYLEEITVAGAPVQSFALPNSGPNMLTTAGSSGTEGQITLSPDNNYLIIAGYNVAAGTPAVGGTASSTVNRKLLRIDNLWNFTPLLSATAFSTSSIRCGVTSGTDFWASGTGATGTNGVQYFGNGTPCQVSSTMTNLRAINIYNGQLYFSTGSSPTGIYQVGTGLPITTGTTSTMVIAGVGTSPSPNAFAFNAANDICYVADDRTSASGGGVQRYTRSGVVWSLAYTLSVGTTGARGLTVDWTGASPVIYATTTESTANKVIKLIDTGSGATPVTLYTAAALTAFKGIAFAPFSGTISAPTAQTSSFTFSSILQTQMNVSWTNGNGAKRVIKINTTNIFAQPADGTDPAANSVYSGSGEQVIYNGSGSTVPTVTGLTTNTTYWFQAWEYNGSGLNTLYCTASGVNNPKDQATAAAATAPLISSPTATSIGQTSAVLGGNITADGGSPIVERGTVWSTSTPVTYNDNRLADGLTATGVFTQSRTGLPVNTLIHYAAYASNSVGTTLSPESSFTTLLPEPSNHPASFTAVAPDQASILNTWLDNNGAQPATGFLLLISTTGVFPTIIDGTPVINDFVLTDGSGAVNLAPGVETYTWTGLNSSTPYYFAIYPYTNTLTNIDYKTVPTAPTANVSTPALLLPVASWTFDATPAAPTTPNSVASNYGTQLDAMLYADGSNGSSVWITTTSGNELTAFGGTALNDPREGTSVVAGQAYGTLGGGTALTANGKKMVIKFSMSGLQDPILSYATRYSSSAGFSTHQWAWSTDGTIFTDFGTNTAPTSSSFATKTLDLSAINAVDGTTVVYLRITFDGATAGGSNNRIDNIIIRATLVPSVATIAATAVGATTATLNGTVNANNQSTAVSFEYGTVSGIYGTSIAGNPTPVSGNTLTSVTADLTGLAQNTPYFYRIVGTYASGTSYGSEMTFTTGCLPTGAAGTITGPATVVANGTTEYVYSVPAIANAVNYIWTFPSFTVFVSGGTTNSVTVRFNPGAITGPVNVFAENACTETGDVSPDFTITVTTGGVPATRQVTGNITTTVCYDATQTITVAGNSTVFEVSSPGVVSMIAGQNILYMPGTKVFAGGVMTGKIVPGGPYCPTDAPDITTGSEETGLTMMDNSFRIYPNPTSGNFTIEQLGAVFSETVKVEVLGTLGGKIMSTELQSTRKQELSIKGNPPGIYFVRVTTGEKVQTVKIILTN